MKPTILQKILPLFLVAVILLLMANNIEAQCAMCKMSGETNLNQGGKVAAGLNQGIIFLLVLPYILVSTIGYLWWRNRKLVEAQEMEDELRELLEPHELALTDEEFDEVSNA